MSDERTLANSIGKTQPHSITFEVSDHFLISEESGIFEWSHPVQFRFEQRDDGYDLVFREPLVAA